jgi:hypothetical protein
MVKEFIEIQDFTSLDELIAKLGEVRERLPDSAVADVKLRGDEVFGRQLCISYMRPQTSAEADCDARYADAYRRSRERELQRLQEELGVVAGSARPRGRRLRIVA